MDFLTDWLFVLRGRLSPVTVTAAVVAAGGMVILLLGLLSIRRVSLAEEAERISGFRRPSRYTRWQTRLYQSGLRIRLWEFALVGLLIGALVGAVFVLLGFATLGLAAIPAGPFVYGRYLMRRRDRVQRQFREQLPDAAHDFVQHFALTRDLPEAIKAMAAKGPPALRPDFTWADSLIRRKVPVASALEAVGRSRTEPFFQQFMDALAQHEVNGGDLRTVLERIARGQRAQVRLHDRIEAQQAGARLVGRVYAAAPVGFLVFMRLMGGESYARFFETPLGQVAQLLVLGSGVAAWWLTNAIARRGIYLDSADYTDAADGPTARKAPKASADEPSLVWTESQAGPDTTLAER